MSSAVIKLGGSLITDKSKPLAARTSIIRQVVQELYATYLSLHKPLWLLGTGTGSYGHYTVIKTGYINGSKDYAKIEEIRKNVMILNNFVVNSMVESGFRAVRLSPHDFIKEATGKPSINFKAFTEILERGDLPIVHGDIIDTDTGSRIITSEEVLELLASHVYHAEEQKLDVCVYATSVDGVLSKLKGLLPSVKKTDTLEIFRNNEYDVTGGMAQKVEAGFRMMQYTKKVYIVNGTRQGSIAQALKGKHVGTSLETESLVA